MSEITREQIKELCKRLEIKADMIQLGETIAYGSDSEIMREAATLIRRLVAERDDAHAEAYTTDEDGQSVTWRELCEAERSIRQFQQRRATDAEAEVERLRAENAELKAWKKRRQEEDEDEADRREIW